MARRMPHAATAASALRIAADSLAWQARRRRNIQRLHMHASQRCRFL
jgi:hypothetical protein